MNHNRRIWLIAGLLFVCAIGATTTGLHAQANPLDRDKPGQPANPTTTDPGTQVGRLFVPEYIKPGARLIYSSGSALEPDDPTKPVSAGVGLTRYDVIAVTPSYVYLIQSTYLERGQGGPVLAGSGLVRINAMEVIGGSALWTSKEALEAMRTHPGRQVVEGPLTLDGATYDTLSTTRIDAQSAMRQIFDKGTGLKLVEQHGVGPPQRSGDPTGFNRKSNSQMQFKTFRQVDMPWLSAKAPDWAANVRTLRYDGRQTMVIPPAAPMATPFTYTVRFEERGEGWAAGKVETHFQGQDAQSIPIVTSNARAGGYWIHPASLAAMKPGVIDRDPTLSSTLSYDVRAGDNGQRLGVLSEEGPGYRLAWAYRLDDGALQYAMQHNAELNMTFEIALAQRE